MLTVYILLITLIGGLIWQVDDGGYGNLMIRIFRHRYKRLTLREKLGFTGPPIGVPQFFIGHFYDIMKNVIQVCSLLVDLKFAVDEKTWVKVTPKYLQL